MPTPEQARRALVLVTSNAVADATGLLTGSPDQVKDRLLVATAEIVSYYSDGSAALAADHYDDIRASASPRVGYVAEPVIRLREEKIRTGVLWAVEPLYRPEPDDVLARSRIGEVVHLESARPFRETITENARRDPAAVGWQRIAAGGCKFCRLLAGRGAVYRADTAHFASHPNCSCSAAPVFDGQQREEANVIQYVAAQRDRSPQQQQALRDALAAMPD